VARPDDVERLLAWWVNHFGAEKILEFGAVKLREARELLRNGRANGTVNRYCPALMPVMGSRGTVRSTGKGLADSAVPIGAERAGPIPG
jgi:hypothetical protein